MTVASTMCYVCESEPSDKEFKELLVASDELETLYDIARITCRTVASTAGVNVALSRSAPVPVVSMPRPLSAPSEEADETSADGAPDALRYLLRGEPCLETHGVAAPCMCSTTGSPLDPVVRSARSAAGEKTVQRHSGLKSMKSPDDWRPRGSRCAWIL